MGDMVEQTLTAKKSALEATVAAEEGALNSLKASESQLGVTVKNAEAALNAQNEVVNAKATALAAAMEAQNASKSKLDECRKEQKEGDAKLATMKTEKEKITSSFDENFPPIQEGEAKAHYKKLEPFLKKIQIESTLLTALPSSCAKAKDKRGTFDVIVLTELEKAFKAKIGNLGEAVEAEGPASVQRAAATEAADADHNAKTAAREQTASECDAAGKEQIEREEALKKAKKAVEDHQPQVEETTARLAAARVAASEFEAGPHANFNTFKNRIAAVPEEEAAEEAAADAPAEEAAPAAEDAAATAS